MPRGRAWAVITTAGLRTFLGQARSFSGCCCCPGCRSSFARCRFYRRLPTFRRWRFIAPTAETFRQFLDQQDVFVFFVTVYVGAGLIANDRRGNALQIYLSKPLTRAEYVFGKMAILMTFLLMVTWLPAMLLLLVQVSFAGSFEFLLDNLYLFPAITLFSFVQAATVSAAMLALSSLSNSSRFVGIIYAGLIFFSDALFGVLRAVTGRIRPVVGVVRQQSRPDRRRDVSRAAALFDALAGVARHDRRARRRLRRHPRTARARCRGHRLMGDRRRPASVEVVRPGDRPQRRDARRSRRASPVFSGPTAPASRRS